MRTKILGLMTCFNRKEKTIGCMFAYRDYDSLESTV